MQQVQKAQELDSCPMLATAISHHHHRRQKLPKAVAQTRWHFSGSTYPAGAIFWSVRWELKSVCLLQTVKNGFYNETEHIVSFIFKLWHLEHTHHWDNFLRIVSFGLCYHLLVWLNPEIFATAETPFLTSKTMNIFLGVSITWYNRQMCWWLKSFMASISNLTRGKSS